MAEKKTNEATRFKPGNQRARKGDHRNRKKPPQLLADMRAVYSQAKEKDKKGGQENCRKLLNENPKEFLSQLRQLEQAWLAQKSRDKALEKPLEPVLPEDDGEKLARERLETVLARLQAEALQKSAVSGPTAADG